MKKTRQANLELLRLLAMVFVVTAHLYLYQSVSVDQQLLSDGIEIQPLEAC